MRYLVVGGLALMISVGSTQAQTPPNDPQQRVLESRAVEAAIWGMPVVNYDLMLQEMLSKTPGRVNEVIYWGKPLDWKNQTLTPNPDTLYFMTFFNTKDVGPIVIDIPPADAGGSLNANIVNVWQQPLEDGGLLGVNLKSHSDADVAASVAYARRLKIYPLSAVSDPPPTRFTDVKEVLFDSTIRYDESFFASLDRIIQSEPWLGRDRALIDPLRSIGIEKGKVFAPDARTKRALKDGITEAHAWMAAKYDAGLPPFFEGTHWTFPAHPELIKAATEDFEGANDYPVDWRGITYHYAYIGIKRLGAGQFYLINIKDKDGTDYDGGKTYRLHVPASVPIDQYWSLTAYDRDTHALIKNVDRASRASNSTEVKKNADGSVDLYIGSKAPAGQESNWIPTDPARKFELMFRLYGPKKEFFEKVWKLPDVENVVATIGSGARQ
jgi:hypothetical protein